MIAKLSGRVDSLGRDCAVVDVGGVGYLVYCSARTLARLAPGTSASLLVETHVREDHIHLYGFGEAAERDWFQLLTTVQGVGAKVALAILSALDTDELARAVAAGDRAALSRAFGVGAKLAGRIASELRDKVVDFLASPQAVAAGTPGGRRAAGLPGAIGDAVSALVNLGFGAAEALDAVSRAAADATAADAAAPAVETLIRGALATLGRRPQAAGGPRAGVDA